MIEEVSLYNAQIDQTLVFSMAEDQEYYFLEYIDFGTVDSNFSTYQTRGTDYKQIKDMQFPSRQIELSAYIASWEEDIETRRDIVNQFFDPKQVINIYVNDTYGIDAYPESTVVFTEELSVNNLNIVHISVRLFAYNPLFYEIELQEQTWTYNQSAGTSVTLSPIIGYTGSDVPVSFDININITSGSYTTMNVYVADSSGLVNSGGAGQFQTINGQFDFGGSGNIWIRSDLGQLAAYQTSPAGNITLIPYANVFKRFVAGNKTRTRLYCVFSNGTAGTFAGTITVRYRRFFFEIRGV